MGVYATQAEANDVSFHVREGASESHRAAAKNAFDNEIGSHHNLTKAMVNAMVVNVNVLGTMASLPVLPTDRETDASEGVDGVNHDGSDAGVGEDAGAGPEADDGAGVGLGSDPLIGTVIGTIMLPVIIGGVVSDMYTGPAKVGPLHLTQADTFLVYFDLLGSPHSAYVKRAAIYLAIATAAAPPPPITIYHGLLQAACGPLVLKLIKSLPLSSASASAQSVSVSEALAVFSNAGIILTVTDSTAPVFGDEFIRASVELSHMLRHDGASTRTWPNLHADRLGKEIRTYHNSYLLAMAAGSTGAGASLPPPARYPRATALENSASTATIGKSFLLSAVDIIKSDPAARSMIKGSIFLQMGALEHFLKSCSKDAIVLASVPAASMSLDELKAFLLNDCVPGSSLGVTPTGPSIGSSSSTSAIHISYTPPDLTGTDFEREQRLAIRIDATAVQANVASTTELARLSLMTQPAYHDMLHASVKAISDDALARIVTTDLDIEKSLQGKPSPITLYACMLSRYDQCLMIMNPCTYPHHHRGARSRRVTVALWS